MLVNKSNLQEALGIVKPGLAKKEVLEQSTSFAFLKNRVIAFNEDFCISHPVKGIRLKGAVETDKLYQLLAKIKQEEIDFEVESTDGAGENNLLIIKAGKIRAGLSLHSVVKLPLEEEIMDRGDWNPLPELFLKLLSVCIPLSATKMSDPILTCIHVNKEGIIESSNNHCLMRCELSEQMPINTFLLPRESARLLITNNPTSISEGKGWVHFKNDQGTVFSSRVFEGKFPDTTMFFTGTNGIKLIFPRKILDMINRGEVFNSESIELSIKNKILTLKAKTEIGWFQEKSNIPYEGTFSFSITPQLLKNILTETRHGQHTKNTLIFTGENWKYVTTFIQ